MTTKRKAPAAPRNWQDADRLVRRHGENRRKCMIVRADVGERIKRLRVEQKDRTNDLLAENAVIEELIKAFALAHPDDLRQRSRKLPSGTIQLRLISEVEPEDGLTDDDLVERIMKLPPKQREGLITGRLRPNRAALRAAKLKPERRIRLGFKLVTHDSLHIKHVDVDLEPV